MPKLTDYTPLKKNPNKGSKRGNDLLETSLEQGGIGRSILVAKNGDILGGNHVTEKVGEMFGADIPVIEVETDGKSLVVVKRSDIESAETPKGQHLILADNRVGDFHEYDYDILQEYEAVSDYFFEDELAGYEESDLAITEDETPDLSLAEQLQEKWQVERGQVWQVGKHRVMCGDAREDLEILLQGQKIDLLHTDPPYGVKMDKGFEGFEGFGGLGAPIARRQYDDNWDNERPSLETFNAILGCSKQSIIWGGNFFADLLPRSSHWIVWDKINTMPTFGDCELAWTNFKRISVKQYTIQYNGLLGKEKERYHPTQKPVKLFIELIQDYSSTGAIVFDAFLGSGTTLVACEQLNRVCYGMEIHPPYCSVTLERLSKLGLTPELVVNHG